MIKPLKYYSNNLCGTEVLLESMVAHGVDKIVFSSTAATYGEPERIPIMESDRTHFRQIVMVKQNCLWRKCLNGRQMHIT